MPTQVKLTELFPARFRGAVTLVTESVLRTASSTLEYEDRGRVVPVDAPGITAVITVPNDNQQFFPIGTVINVYNVNSSESVQLAPAPGVDLISPQSLSFLLVPQTEVSLRKRAPNEWVVAGVLV